MSNQESAQGTIEDKLKEILGYEDWQYTDKPHRILSLITTETTKAIQAELNDLIRKSAFTSELDRNIKARLAALQKEQK